jgi:hypothetical protein
LCPAAVAPAALVKGHEAVIGVDELGVLETVRAVIPVWAVQALVADTVDVLVAAIADSAVMDIPARTALAAWMRRHRHVVDLFPAYNYFPELIYLGMFPWEGLC